MTNPVPSSPLRRSAATIVAACVMSATLLLSALAPGDAASASIPAPGTTALVSATAAGDRGAGQSHQNSVSTDGRFVAFTSTSALTGATTGAASQVFVKDMTTGVVRLVSADGDEGEPMLRDADAPSMSADGRYVAFVAASVLTPYKQIWVRDLNPGGSLRLVSVAAGTTNAANGASLVPSIAGDGRSVAFESRATDLVAGVMPSVEQIYRADLAGPGSGTVRLVSLKDGTSDPADQSAGGPASSFDGSVIAFASLASNLTSDALVAGAYQVFVHDMNDGSTTLVSSAASGAPTGADRGSFGPELSADGRKVAFISTASNLTSRAAPVVSTRYQVYLRDLDGTAASTLVSVDRTGNAPAELDVLQAALSADGTRVGFTSAAGNLVPRANPAEWSIQALVRDMPTGVTTLVSAQSGTSDAGATTATAYISLSGDGRFVGFATGAGKMAAPTEAAGNSAVYLRNVYGTGGPVSTSVIQRIGGADRYAVSAEVSRLKYDAGVPVAYIAAGVVFPDALSGSAAAGLGGGPVLLTRKDVIPDPVAAELRRLQPGRVVVLGGTATVSPSVQKALEEFVARDPSRVKRIAGADRYEVSAAVSAATFMEGVDVAYVASGAVFPDALSGSAAAGLRKGPVLLVAKDSVPPAIIRELARLKPKSIVVLGGSSTVADSVVGQLKSEVANTTRLAGADRYIQSAEVANASFLATGGTVFVASGQVFPDALSGSAAAIRAKAPVLLVAADRIQGDVAGQLARLAPTRIVVLGGEATVSTAVYEQLRGYLAK